MTVLSVSFAYLQYSAGVNATRTPSTEPKPAPAPAPAAPSEHAGCDSPRRSPLVRALTEALGELVKQQPSAQTTTATSTDAVARSSGAADRTAANGSQATPASDAAAATASTTRTDNDNGATLEQALMAFARALGQALRGDTGHGDDAGRGHHHRHHHRGRHGWGDASQRVEQLAAQMGAPAPAAGTASADAVADTASSDAVTNTTQPTAAEPASAQVGDQVLQPVRANSEASTQATVVYVKLELKSDAATLPRAQRRLLDSFAQLQQALGRPEANDGDALKSQLAEFLRALANKLDGTAATVAAPTQSGSLISVQA